MICDKCGYMMDAFDQECARCQGKGIPQSNSNNSALATPSGSSTLAVKPNRVEQSSTMAQTRQSRSVLLGLILGLVILLAFVSGLRDLTHIVPITRRFRFEWFSVFHFPVNVAFLLFGVAMLKLRRWGAYGLTAISLCMCIIYLATDMLVYLLLPLLALLAVLTSVLTKDWDLMK